MGNRAVITYADYSIGYDEEKREPIYESNEFIDKSHRVGIYLHWNGGYDSVHAFLEYCKLQEFRCDSYGIARLAQVISNFFGGGLSIGVDQCCRLDCDNYDNGVYLVRDWNIVDRKCYDGPEQDTYNLYEFMEDVNDTQPVKMRIPKEVIWSREVKAGDLNVGDTFYHFDYLSEGYKLETVKELPEHEEGKRVNGSDIYDLVYFGDRPTNPNDYVRKTDTVRVPMKKED